MAETQTGLHRPDISTDIVCRLYLNGATLDEVAGRFGCSRHTVASRLDKKGIARRSQGAWSRKRGGPYWLRRDSRNKRQGWMFSSARDGKPVPIHRACCEACYGPIPTGWQVHHIDNNKLNNDPENLIALHPGVHSALTLLKCRHAAAHDAALEVLLAEHSRSTG